jgi:hypothetical protein
MCPRVRCTIRANQNICSGDGGSRTRSSSVQARRSAARASSPRCGRVDSNDHSTRQRGYSPLSSPMLSVRTAKAPLAVPTSGRAALPRDRLKRVTDRARTGTARLTTSDACRLHHGHQEREAGTTGLEPAASRLTSERSALLSYVPEKSRGWDSNPRSRAHEAREDSRSSTAQVWPAGVEPAIPGARSRWGGQPPPQPEEKAPPAGLEPAASGLRARRHRRFDHGGVRLRRQDSNPPLASNSRASYRLDHTGTKERKERESNPQGPRTHPFSRRGTAPVAVLPGGLRQASNLHRPG